MRRGFKALILTALLTLGTTITVFAGTWQNTNGTYRYLKDDGTYAVNEWQSNQGAWYRLDANGLLQTGWVQDNGFWYYLEPSGVMRTEALSENGKVYYFGADGACLNPNGEAIGITAGQVSEEGYVGSVLNLMAELEAAIVPLEQQFENLGSGDFEGAKQLIRNIQVPFHNFLSVTAPDRFKEADIRLKNSCSGMVQALDGLITVIDGAANGNLTAPDAMAQMEALNFLVENSMNEFEAGANILDNLLK